MITEKIAKRLIEQAEYNCSGENVAYNIDNIKELSEEGAYLVIASSENIKTSFVCYDNGHAYFLDDWQGTYPTIEEEIQDYNWVTIDWKTQAIVLFGLPRNLLYL